MEKKVRGLFVILVIIVISQNVLFAQAIKATDTIKMQATQTVVAPKSPKAESRKPCIALTFDDGIHKTLTPKLLDILKKNDVEATFFVIGSSVKAHPSIAKRIHDDGHELGDHTWSHAWLTRIGLGKVSWQIQNTKDIIFKTVGVKPKVFRPPYGATNQSVANVATKLGLRQIIWDVDPRDWRDPSPQHIINYILKNAHDGDIVLMHDTHGNTVRAVPGIIAGFRKKGYDFVTVSSILEVREEKWLAKKAKKEVSKKAKT